MNTGPTLGERSVGCEVCAGMARGLMLSQKTVPLASRNVLGAADKGLSQRVQHQWSRPLATASQGCVAPWAGAEGAPVLCTKPREVLADPPGSQSPACDSRPRRPLGGHFRLRGPALICFFVEEDEMC